MKRKIFSNIFSLRLLGVVFVALFLFVSSASTTHAQLATASTVVADIPGAVKNAKDTILQSLEKAAQVSFLSSLRAVVNQIAYDTATYIGSGGTGQKPLFYTEPFDKWLLQQGDKAAGNFIESFAAARQQSGDGQGGVVDTIFASKFNICAPDLNVTARISLGLTNEANAGAGLQSDCSLSKIYKDVQGQYQQLYGSPDARAAYLKNLALSSFSPATTDVGAAFTIFGAYTDTITSNQNASQLVRTEAQGWINPTSTISGNSTAPPGDAQRRLSTADTIVTNNFGKQTGNIFADAANIFLNQLALSAFNRLIASLGKSSSSSSNVANFNAQGNNSGGVNEIQQRASTILQAQFNDLTDYDILAQLSSCSSETNPGPTNCVITQQFSQAISGNMTVGQAIEHNLLDKNKRIGFDQQGNEMSYRDGYPYRSLIILRKYRILPVGWEVAAQYMKDHPQETKDVTLGDLVACFSSTDQTYPGYSQAWCQGLIDPNWPLKVPKMYCGMQGYGPEIMSATVTPSDSGYCAKTADNCSGSTSGNCATNNQPCTSTDPSSTECSNIDPTYPKCNFTVGRDVQVVRNNSYCADEQSCIKENNNGSCAYYGYCTQEKRRWVFTQAQDNSCEARNNTCDSFRTDSGAQVSYLENTLNYQSCGANQVGCRQYSMTGVYDAVSNKVAWDTHAQSQHYYNQNMTSCDPASEGCHQFVRTADNLDTNLIADGSFENSTCINNSNGTKLPDKLNPFINSANAQVSLGCTMTTFTNSGYLPSPNDHWYIHVSNGTVKAGISTDQADNGTQNSLFVQGQGGLYSTTGAGAQLLPAGFSFEADRFYTLSASVFVTTGTARVGFGLGSNAGQFAESNTTGSWQNLVVTYYGPQTSIADNIYIEGTDPSTTFYIDSVKLTIGNANTAYNDYLSNNVIYEKLLPPYLETSCYQDPGTDYTLKPNAPTICNNFVRKCNADEVGCKKYISSVSGIDVTAKAKPKDFCPTSCVGYNVFVQQVNNFNAMQSAYFIPSTARSCSAQAVGCTAFTNLDKLAAGGEAVEYYTDLRTCIKPDALSCDQFYSWEGSDDSGYQLRVFSLKKNGSEPASTIDPVQEAQLCNADIFKKTPADPGYNFDCREFYARDGTVSYHLYSKTISCSADCHPYRREVASAAECTSGGGAWDASQSRCLYYAIPSEGTTCSASEVGCQEYTGNIAGNVRDILVSTFENTSNPTDGWTGGAPSNTALNLGGHSLLGSSLSNTVGDQVSRGLSYTVSFLAKAQSGSTTLNGIDFVNQDNQTANFDTSGAAVNNTDWKLYTFNLANLDHDVTAVPGSGGNSPGTGIGEKLQINFSSPVYIDNIRLTEVPNRYYLLKNSWQTPDECDQDISGGFSLHYMLGCSQYTDADKNTVNIHSFSQLCQDSAAGCEQMIDTHNSNSAQKKLYNDTNNNGVCDPGETGCVAVANDSMVNVVYDKTKFCDTAQKGCSRLGQASTYDNATIFTDIYKKDDPETYATSICSSDAVGCSQYTDKNGATNYFKDPGNEVCEWRLPQGTRAGNYGWFKKQVERCGGTANGTLCSDNSQCTNQSCTLVTTDVPCAVSPNKTLGTGGMGGRAFQPNQFDGTNQWAGACDATQSSCSEYVDPISSFNQNIVRNPNCTKAPTQSICDDPWVAWVDGGSSAYQIVSLSLHTTYILKGDPAGTAGDDTYVDTCTIDGARSSTVQLYQLDPVDNNFKLKTPSRTDAISGHGSIEFYVAPAASEESTSSAETVSCHIVRNNQTTNKTVDLRKADVEYQLGDNVDRTTPNGVANTGKGYILFNERAQAGTNKAALLYNADETLAQEPPVDGTTPKTSPPPLNANVILKVQPDRSCSQWLACNTSLPDANNPNKQTCLDVGLCDSLDSDGKCLHFISAPKQNQTVTNSDISNMTGYSKVSYAYSPTQPSALVADDYNLANMVQAGENLTTDFNGSFESNSHWAGDTSTLGSLVLIQPGDIANENLNPFHNIKSNASARDTGNFLAPVGKGLGRLGFGKSLDQDVSLSAGKKYVISAYLYSKDAADAGIKLKWSGGEQKLISMQNDVKNNWVNRTMAFTAPSGTNFQIEIYNNSTNQSFYLDEITIETSLNYRCSQQDKDSNLCVTAPTPPIPDPNTNPVPAYISPMCRLFPKEDSLSCRETDQNGVTTKGLQGYCLETDPLNPDTCLLWYPIDKIASEHSDEGIGINIGQPADVAYYCISASATQCASTDPTKPILFCDKYIAVEKSKYWYDRLKPNSDFKIASNQFFDTSVLYPSMTINLGARYNIPNTLTGTHGVINFSQLDVNTGGQGFYGVQLSPGITPSETPITVDQTNGNISSYIPYWLTPYDYHYAAYNQQGLVLAWPNGQTRKLCFDPQAGSNLSGDVPMPFIQEQGAPDRPWDSVYALAVHHTDNTGCTVSCNNSGCTNHDCGLTVFPIYTYSENSAQGGNIGVGGATNNDPNVWAENSGNKNVFGHYSVANNIKDFSVAKSEDAAKKIIERLFTPYNVGTDPNINPNGLWKEYDWNSSTSTYALNNSITNLDQITRCKFNNQLDVRPPTYQIANATNSSDYCYVLPQVTDFMMNSQTGFYKTNSLTPVPISFKTHTDKNQLPIATIVLDFGYQVAGSEKTITIANTVGDSNPRYVQQVFNYSEIQENGGNCVAANQPVPGTGLSCQQHPCCVIKPHIVLTDNWGYYDDNPYSNWLMVEQSAE